MQKNILSSLVLLLVGAIIGGVIVHGYYNSSTPRRTSRGTSEEVCQAVSQESFQETSQELPLNLADASAYLKFKEIRSSFIPSGVPDIYGQELNISFDEVQDAIDKVAPFGPTYGKEKIVLTGADLKRYIKVGFQISCQYCCGVKTLVFENGEAACGCAHSQMMRGLTAYLIKNHPELSDERILEELNKWKITYFPKQTLSSKLKELEEAGESGIKEILEEFPDFLPQMVGGC